MRSPHQVPTSGNASNDKKDNSTLNFFKRMLSGHSNKNNEDILSPASVGSKPKGILIRATTDRKTSKPKKRQSIFADLMNNNEEESIDSERLMAYRRY